MSITLLSSRTIAATRDFDRFCGVRADSGTTDANGVARAPCMRQRHREWTAAYPTFRQIVHTLDTGPASRAIAGEGRKDVAGGRVARERLGVGSMTNVAICARAHLHPRPGERMGEKPS